MGSLSSGAIDLREVAKPMAANKTARSGRDILRYPAVHGGLRDDRCRFGIVVAAAGLGENLLAILRGSSGRRDGLRPYDREPSRGDLAIGGKQ